MISNQRDSAIMFGSFICDETTNDIPVDSTYL